MICCCCCKTWQLCDQGRKFASKAMALVSDSQKMQAIGLRFEDANQDDEGEESEDNEA